MAKLELELLIKDAQAASSVGDIRNQLKDLKNAMLSVGQDSAEFDKLAQAAAQLKERVNEANESIANFSPDTLETVGNFAGKAAAGVSLVTGAMGLLGVESEDTQKMMMKVQAAMAFAQGLQQMKGVVSVMQNMASVIKTNLVSAFSTLKGAIAATGIGALVIAIGFAIEAIGEYNDSVEEQAEKQKKLNEELQKTNELYDAQASKSEVARNAKEGGLDQLRREIDLMKANGATADELYEKKKEIIDKELYNLSVRKATVIEGSELEQKYQKDILDKQNELAILNAEHNNKKVDSHKVATEKIIAQEKISNDDLLWENERLGEELIAQMEAENAAQDALIAEHDQHRLEMYQADRKAKEEAYKKAHDYKKKLDEIERKREEQMAKDKIDFAKNVLGTLSVLMKDNADAQKAISAATTLIDTYAAAQSAFKAATASPITTAFPAYPFIQAGLAVAAGLARVAAIMRVDTSGASASSGGGSAGMSGGGSLSVSSQPNVSSGSQPSTLLTEQGNVMNQQSQNPIYVSVQEIRETGQVVETIEERSRF